LALNRQGAGNPSPPLGFEERVRAATSLHDLAQLFTVEVKPFGFSAYAVGQLRGAGRSAAAIYLTTWPRGWMETYAANAFIVDDPVVRAALAAQEPFTWEEAFARLGESPENRVVEAAAGYGFKAGFAVPIHGPGEVCGIVALAAARMQLKPEDRPVLAAKARLVYEVARQLYTRADRPASNLSSREREVLALVAQGLDDAEIGAALGITKTSAHVYVERAKRRLGATTRAQAVALAVADGLL
jgi:DNA-binding CsgD family transcriptional regulator